jgi:hypothetical protein
MAGKNLKQKVFTGHFFWGKWLSVKKISEVARLTLFGRNYLKSIRKGANHETLQMGLEMERGS